MILGAHRIVGAAVLGMLAAGAAGMPVLAQSASGVTRYARIAELRPITTGTVAEIFVTEGTDVVAGAPLIALDDSVQAARVAIARIAAEAAAPIARAEAAADAARARLARIQRAVRRGGAPEWEAAEAAVAVEIADADLAAAREQRTANAARLSLETAALAEFTVTAPFDGTVLEITAVTGMLADGRDPLIVMADRSRIEIVAFVDARQARASRVGADVVAMLGAPVDARVEAALIHVDPRIEPASGTVRAVFALDVPDRSIPAGVAASVTLPAGETLSDDRTTGSGG